MGIFKWVAVILIFVLTGYIEFLIINGPIIKDNISAMIAAIAERNVIYSNKLNKLMDSLNDKK